MKRFLIAVVALASAVENSEEVSDDRIKSMIIGSESYIDNSRAAERLYNNARRRCGDDTNRFARILCELAQTDDKHIADRMIYRLGWHGTPAQLPFLYTMATNEQHGATAVKSILRLEGVTSNSLAAVDQCLSMTNVQARMERENLCLFMLDSFVVAQVCVEVRNAVEQCILRFARGSTVYNEYFDSCLSRRMPGYKFSKRRLDVLRIAEHNLTIRFNEHFITNAINELVAYPESDLPE